MTRRPRAGMILAVVAVAAPVAFLLADRLPLVSARQPHDLPDLETLQRQSADLDQVHRETFARHRVNETIVSDLAAGRLSLRDADDLYWEANHDVPGFVTAVSRFAGVTDPRVALRLNLLRLVRTYLCEDRPAKAAATARLTDEYEAAYGPFPLRSPTDLDG